MVFADCSAILLNKLHGKSIPEQFHPQKHLLSTNGTVFKDLNTTLLRAAAISEVQSSCSEFKSFPKCNFSPLQSSKQGNEQQNLQTTSALPLETRPICESHFVLEQSWPLAWSEGMNRDVISCRFVPGYFFTCLGLITASGRNFHTMWFHVFWAGQTCYR